MTGSTAAPYFAFVPATSCLAIKTINGQLMQRVDIQPGESQLWRFSDHTANTYFRRRDGRGRRLNKLVAESTETGPVGDVFPAQNMALVVSASAPGQALAVTHIYLVHCRSAGDKRSVVLRALAEIDVCARRCLRRSLPSAARLASRGA